MEKRKTTVYTLSTAKLTRPVTFAVAADLHNAPFEDALPVCAQADAVLVPGDLLNRHREGWENALRFLEEVSRSRPVFYSLGNHERRYSDPDGWLRVARKSGAVLLDNAAVGFGEVSVGALSSVPSHHAPDSGLLRKLSGMAGFRLLLCHHPEYYASAVSSFAIDLTVAGHAHGGQVRLFGRGLYAPGQGLFPRWTNGFYFNNRLLVSRGMTNSASVPRLNNPCEILLLRLVPEGEKETPGNDDGRGEANGRV